MLPSPYHLTGPSPSYSQVYHLMFARAQAVFQRRLDTIEIELAQAQHTLDKLDLATGSHSRLGQDSPLMSLPEDLLRAIAVEGGRV